jgi:hypothetical protein
MVWTLATVMSMSVMLKPPSGMIVSAYRLLASTSPSPRKAKSSQASAAVWDMLLAWEHGILALYNVYGVVSLKTKVSAFGKAAHIAQCCQA